VSYICCFGYSHQQKRDSVTVSIRMIALFQQTITREFLEVRKYLTAIASDGVRCFLPLSTFLLLFFYDMHQLFSVCHWYCNGYYLDTQVSQKMPGKFWYLFIGLF